MAVKPLLLALVVLLAGCGGQVSTETAVSAPSTGAGPSVEPSGASSPEGAGRLESLQCIGEGSMALSVDYTVEATGLGDAAEAARALADQQGVPRAAYGERLATGPLGEPVLELLAADGRVVAFVTVGRTTDGDYVGSGLSGCGSVFGG